MEFQSKRYKNIIMDFLFLISSTKNRIFYYMEDYKVFTGTLINMLLTFIGYFILWKIILANTDMFVGVYNTWDMGSILMLIGFSELAFAIDALFTFGLAYIPRIINEEGLESYSIYPISTMTAILGKNSEPIDGFAGIIWSTIFIAIAHYIYNVPISIFGLIIGVITLIIGIVIISGLYIILASLSFKYGMLEAPMDFITTIYVSFARVPHDIFPLSIRYFLTFILPVALLSTYPTILTMSLLTINVILKLFLIWIFILLVIIITAYLSWTTGKKSYQPVGG